MGCYSILRGNDILICNMDDLRKHYEKEITYGHHEEKRNSVRGAVTAWIRNVQLRTSHRDQEQTGRG